MGWCPSQGCELIKVTILLCFVQQGDMDRGEPATNWTVTLLRLLLKSPTASYEELLLAKDVIALLLLNVQPCFMRGPFFSLQVLSYYAASSGIHWFREPKWKEMVREGLSSSILFRHDQNIEIRVHNHESSKSSPPQKHTGLCGQWGWPGQGRRPNWQSVHPVVDAVLDRPFGMLQLPHYRHRAGQGARECEAVWWQPPAAQLSDWGVLLPCDRCFWVHSQYTVVLPAWYKHPQVISTL